MSFTSSVSMKRSRADWDWGGAPARGGQQGGQQGEGGRDDEEGEEAPKFMKAEASVLAGRRQVSAHLQNKRKEYLRHLRALNASFFDWLQRHVREAPQSSLADAAQDYVDYSSQLQDRYLKEYGEVFTFGSGDCGQLAHGTEHEEDLMVKFPRIVYSLRNKKVSGISCGGLHNAAVTEDGLVYTWGCSDDGSLGRDGEETLPLLVQGGGLEAQTVIAVACGDGQTLALSASGDVFGWGCYKDKEGQKWFNPTPECAVPSRDVQKQQNTPIKITGLSDVVEVACGSGFNIARCSNGNIFSWGIGECGELGRDVCPLKKPYDVDGVYSSHITPGPMRDAKGAVVRNAKAIGCGAYHSLVVVIDEAVGGSKLLTCGLNNYGQLGHGDTKNLPRLEEVTALSGKGIVSVKGGFHHSLVLSATGDMFAFGRGDSGQLGIKAMANSSVGDFQATPELVSMPPAGGRVIAISCGSNHNFALTVSEEVYSWGYGEMLALGHGRDKDEALPRRVAFESNELAGVKVSHVACGGQHSAFIGRVLGIK